jgi:predicted TIM-barrel fold metal-dependent hydrolase
VTQLRPDLFLPEPEQREVKYTVISVDDHLVEPPDAFEGRFPAKFAEQAPRVVVDDDGNEGWVFNGDRLVQVGAHAQAGRRKETVEFEPARYDEMRPGCWNIHERVKDMDINGVWAAMNFPSGVTGFCGRVFTHCKDAELGKVAVKAWNDWLFEDWYSPYPQRMIPLGMIYMADAQEGAAEIRRNAERGFRSVTLPERPQGLGLPSLFSGHWDPIIEACAETDTVISLHVGSSGGYPTPDDVGEARQPLAATLFGQLSLAACCEWLWSGYAVRHPTLKIAMSEGGIGWVPMLIDRLDNLIDRSGYGLGWSDRPSDVLRRNFSFCTLDDPSTIELRHVIGVENIMLETDFPHGDGTWPDTQQVVEKYWGHIPNNELRKMCSENAAALYRHPLPPVVLPQD